MQVFKNIFREKYCIYIIPILAFVWYLVGSHIAGPFYFSRIDPEYPYLLNGLSFAIPDFNRIGHIDHPGTPFQFLTGIFIRITHLFAGQDSIIEDVFGRPEFYLSWANFYFNCLTILVLFWLGKLIHDLTKNWIAVFLLQGTVLINTLLIDTPERYIPDRLLIILVLVLVGLIVKKYHNSDYSNNKFAIQTGILLGIGFVTKFNFLPLLIIPIIILFKWKERFIYMGTLLISIAICFLPIYKKFYLYRSFITSIIHHDGLYGQGQDRMLNLDSFIDNLLIIFKQNGSYAILIIVSLILTSLSIRKRYRFQFNFEFRILIAIIITTIISSILIAKHFKNYYALPMVSLGGLLFYINYSIINKLKSGKYSRFFALLILLVLIVVPIKRLMPIYANTLHKRRADKYAESFINNTITINDYFFVEPTWIWGAFPENGLVYGCSYAGWHHLYYSTIEKLYPNIITWEGFDNPMKFFRIIDANTEAIFKSGNNIYIYSTPGRNAAQLIDYIKSVAQLNDVQISPDTVFSNSHRSEFIIKISHTDNWKTLQEEKCSFEKVIRNQLYSDNETMLLEGLFESEYQQSYNGLHAIRLKPSLRQSPAYKLTDVKPGDHLEFSIKCYSANNEEDENLDIYLRDAKGKVLDSINTKTFYSSLFIKPKWKMRRVNFTIPQNQKDSIVNAGFVYDGTSEIILDDFRFSHYGRR